MRKITSEMRKKWANDREVVVNDIKNRLAEQTDESLARHFKSFSDDTILSPYFLDEIKKRNLTV